MNIQPHLLEHENSSLMERTWPALLLIAGLISVIYANSLWGVFHFDDGFNIKENFNLRRFSRLKTYFLNGKRPLAYFSFAVNYHLHGLDITGYHIINILIHMFAAAALYFFLKGTFKLSSVPDWIRHKAPLIAFISTILWAVNPIQTMAVTYIVQRMASMAILFYFLALLSYLKARTADSTTRKWGFLVLTLALYICAILTKQNTAILPFMILIYEFIFFQSAKVSFFKCHYGKIAGCILLFMFTALYLRYGLPFLSDHTQDNVEHSMKLLNRHPFTIWERLLTETRVLFTYLILFLLPIGYNSQFEGMGCEWKGFYFRLNLDHDFLISRGFLSPPSTLLCILLIILLTVYALTHLRKRPVISFFIVWFFVNSVIEHTIIPLAPIYEYRAYLPSVTFTVLITLALVYMTKERARARSVILLTAVVLYGALTIGRNAIYSDSLLMAKDTIIKSPHFTRAYMRLANAYINLDEREFPGRKLLGLKAIEKGLEHAAENRLSRGNLLLCKATILCDLEKTEPALACAKEAFNLLTHKAKLYVLLGRIYSQKKMYRLARDYFLKAFKTHPTNMIGWVSQLNYATCLRNLGNYHISKKILLRLKEGFPEEQIVLDLNLGIVAANLGEKKAAIEYFQTAANLDTAIYQAIKKIGINHLRMARTRRTPEKARAGVWMLEFYLHAFPDDPEVYKHLGDNYVWSHNLDKAEKMLIQSHKLMPDASETIEDLLWIAEQQKKTAKVRAWLKKLIHVVTSDLAAAEKKDNTRMIRILSGKLKNLREKNAAHK